MQTSVQNQEGTGRSFARDAAINIMKNSMYKKKERKKGPKTAVAIKRGSIKLNKMFWRKGKSKFLLPRAVQEGLVKNLFEVYAYGGLLNALEKKIGK